MKYLVLSLLLVGVGQLPLQGQVRTEHPEPRSVQEAMETFQLREGFQIELVVAEPMVLDPIYLDWGTDGRLWVVEMADYNDQQPGGRVRWLEDQDSDGQYERSVVFLSGLQNPTAVIPWRDGVLVSAAPEIFFAKDTDGDGVADFRETLYRGFGTGNQQHRVNGFAWGLDNWLYVANGDSGGTIESVKTGEKLDIGGRDLRIRPRTGSMQALTGQTQFGRRRDDWGNWFSCSNSIPLRHMVLKDHYLKRNPHFAPPTPRRDMARTNNTQVFPRAEVISHWSGYRPPEPGEPHRFTSASGICIYRDHVFGEGFFGNVFVCEPIHNLVHRRLLTAQGVLFESKRPDDERKSEFLSASDSWFRPTMVRTGPDGALWLTDMYRVAIEHADYMSDEQKSRRDVLLAGRQLGRIYRVTPTQGVQRYSPNYAALNPTQIVAELNSPNGWRRDAAHRWIVTIGGDRLAGEVVPWLKADRPVTRLHALCVLDGLGKLQADELVRALADSHPSVRRQAVRICESWLPKNETWASRLAQLVDDVDPQVRLQLAYSLGESHHHHAAQALAQILLASRDDPYTVAAVMSSVVEHNVSEILREVYRRQREGDSNDAIQNHLLDIAAAYGQTSALAETLDVALQQNAKASPAWVMQIARLIYLCRRHPELLAVDSDRARVLRKLGEQLLPSAEQAEDPQPSQVSLMAASLHFLGALPIGVMEQRVLAIGRFLHPQYEPQLQRAAIQALAETGESEVPQQTLDAWGRLSPDLRDDVVDMLLTRTAWCSQLLEQIESGSVRRTDLSPSHLQRLLNHNDDSVKARAATLVAGVNRDRQQVISKYHSSLQTGGDPQQGAAIFAKHCAACHLVDGKGHAVGPDLSALKDRSPDTILTAVLDPNRAIEDKYRTYTIITDDAKTHSGVVEAETSNSVTLLMKEGKRENILRSKIDELLGTSISLMPEGLEKEISPEMMTHLLAYVGNLQPPPKSFPGNSPRDLDADTQGRFTLGADTARIYGSTLVFEAKYRNLGFWQSEDDQAVWRVNAQQPGRYDVKLEYACPGDSAQNSYRLTLGQQEIMGQVDATGSWDNYQSHVIGQVNLPKGMTTVFFESVGDPQPFLIDLQSIQLVPVGR